MGLKQFLKSLMSVWAPPRQAVETHNVLPDRDQRLHLRFKAVVQDGYGSYSRLVFPGKSALLKLIKKGCHDWPEQLCQGSLNCGVTEFPANFNKVAGKGEGLQKLDKGSFTPEFGIPSSMIKGNQLGIANVWKCVVTNDNTQEQFDAWHVRRVGASYLEIMELMSDKRMRDAYGLKTGTPLTIDMWSGPQL